MLNGWIAVLVATIASPAMADAGPPRHAVRWTPPAIATAGYETSPSFTPDGREMFYVSADARFRGYRLMHSRCEQGSWTPGREPPFAAPRPTLEADPFVTHDGSQLYFVSARHDPRNEDLDIYRVDRRPDGSWGTPVRLPAPVNSTSSELLPRQDGSGALFFGSARAGGFGQSDIYVADEGDEGRWTVRNVGPPVSTAANEYEAEVSRDGRSLVVVVDRGDLSHLHRFEKVGSAWREIGRVPAASEVFQVGPLLSPSADRLLFAQAVAGLSGELFLVDLRPEPRRDWPPTCK